MGRFEFSAVIGRRLAVPRAWVASASAGNGEYHKVSAPLVKGGLGLVRELRRDWLRGADRTRVCGPSWVRHGRRDTARSRHG